MLPNTGKILPSLKSHDPIASRLNYEGRLAAALREELGESRQMVKCLMRWTGASERTAKDWLATKRGPNGHHLIALMRHSDAVLWAVLDLADRTALMRVQQNQSVRQHLLAALRLLG